MPHRLLLLALAGFEDANAEALSEVSPCDLRRLAESYGMPERAARRQLKRLKRASTTIETELGPMPDKIYYEVLAAQKVPAKCSFLETRYSYADAEGLASVWGVSPAEAKAMVEAKIAQGTEYDVTYALSGKLEYDTYDTLEDAAFAAFWARDKYTYCDAVLLASVWGTDEYEAKMRIGEAIVSTDAQKLAGLDRSLSDARARALATGVRCEFWETDLSYEDAQRLATVWGLPVVEAKARATDMVLRGQMSLLLSLLGQ